MLAYFEVNRDENGIIINSPSRPQEGTGGDHRVGAIQKTAGKLRSNSVDLIGQLNRLFDVFAKRCGYLLPLIVEFDQDFERSSTSSVVA
jgi:hypothetical protein